MAEVGVGMDAPPSVRCYSCCYGDTVVAAIIVVFVVAAAAGTNFFVCLRWIHGHVRLRSAASPLCFRLVVVVVACVVCTDVVVAFRSHSMLLVFVS